MKSSSLAIAAIAICMAVAGCQSYTELPFDPKVILQDLKKARNAQTNGPTLTFSEAARLMDAGNLELKEIRAAYDTLKVIAELPTPLPNPEIEVGSGIGHRLDAPPRSVVQPFVSLGFAIPLGPRLSREDDLNAIRAEAAKIAVAAKHRALYIALRHAFVRHTLASERKARRIALTTLIKTSDEVSVKLKDAGTIGELELNQGFILNRLEELGQIEDDLEADDAAGELADLVGLNPETISKKSVEALPKPPALLPRLKALESDLVENNAELSALRMAFLESDAQLRLELAKQYPDVNVGLGFEQEPGGREQIFELGIGIELPFFDLNKQGIAEAFATRKAAKVAYEAKLGSLLTQLQTGIKRYALHHKMLNKLEELLPMASKNREDAQRLTEIGTFDFMKYLDISKAHAELTLQALEQQSSLWAALAELESIVGSPLVAFPTTDQPKKKEKEIDKK